MDSYTAIKKRRSIRKFKDESVDREILKKCVNAGRLSPTAANLQPLKFLTITKKLNRVFSATSWGGYLDWDPKEKNMPRAYIAILKDREKGWEIDVGLAAQSVCLTAVNEGLGTCILGAIDKEKLSSLLPIPDGFELKLLIALGYPDENSEVVEDSDNVEYYYEGNTLKVPKKPIEDIWIEW
ncbi:MAG: nitroreductase family protein [Thermoplasmatota archaeon]